MKKLLITLGTAVAVVAPLSTVVSCSEETNSYTIDFGRKIVTYRVEDFNLDVFTNSRVELLNRANDQINELENKLSPEDVKIFAERGRSSVKWTSKNLAMRNNGLKFIFSFKTFLTLGDVRVEVENPYNFKSVRTVNVAATQLQKDVVEQYKKKLKSVVAKVDKINADIKAKEDAAKAAAKAATNK